MPISDDQKQRLFPVPPTDEATGDPRRPADETPSGGGSPIADGRDRQPDPRSVTVHRIGGMVATSILAAGSLLVVTVLALLGSLGRSGGLLAYGAWIVVFPSLFALTVIWPGVSYRHTFYRVSEEGIQIRRGVFWRSAATVPRTRVQHTDVSQGPVERMFDLATLIVYTAGTQHASVHLPGLAHETALRIRDHLIDGPSSSFRRGEDDAV